jgi:hypothetical protein
MPAPTSTPTLTPNSPGSPAKSADFTASLQERLSRLTDLGLLFAFGAGGAIFYAVVASPGLSGVRRTYMELGNTGRLACASLFMTGLILLLLSLFWVFVHVGTRLRVRPGDLAEGSQAAVAAGFEQAQEDAGTLLSQTLAEMRKQGATAQELAQARALIESVTRKIAIISQQSAAEYKRNPQSLEQDIRATVARLEKGEDLDGGFKR